MIESDLNEDDFALDSEASSRRGGYNGQDTFRDGNKFTNSNDYDRFDRDRKKDYFGNYMDATGRNVRDEDRYKSNSYKQAERSYGYDN